MKKTHKLLKSLLLPLLFAACASSENTPPGPTPDRGVTNPDRSGGGGDTWVEPDLGQVPDRGSGDAATDRAVGDVGPLPDLGAPVVGSFVPVKAGTFQMGSPADEPCRKASSETQHEVILTHDFEIAALEVTQGEYETAMGYNPAANPTCGSDCPVEDLNRHEAAAYCNALSKAKGHAECYTCTGTGADVVCEVAAAYTGGATIYDCPGYRLPTDAEWEFAYRAGTKTAYYIGDNDPAQCSGTDTRASQIGWYNKNSGGETHAGGLKQGNAFGLFDMAGNVHEWVNDFYVADLGTAQATNPVGAAPSAYGILRGGSFAHAPSTIRAAYRQSQTVKGRGTAVGFRCARSTN